MSFWSVLQHIRLTPLWSHICAQVPWKAGLAAGGDSHFAVLQLPPACSTLEAACIQEERAKHRAPGTAGGGLWDLMEQMRTSRRKQRDQFGKTDGGQGSQKIRRGKERWGSFRRRKAEEEAGCCQSPPAAVQTQRWRSRLQKPEKRNEKAKKRGPGEALEWEDSTALIST